MAPTILRRGPEWFSGMGRKNNHGERFLQSPDASCCCTLQMLYPLHADAESLVKSVSLNASALLASHRLLALNI